MPEPDAIPLTPELFEEEAGAQGGTEAPELTVLNRIKDDVETVRDGVREMDRKFDEVLKLMESMYRAMLEQ